MAVIFGYSISDPLLDSSYPLYAMDGIAAYAIGKMVQHA